MRHFRSVKKMTFPFSIAAVTGLALLSACGTLDDGTPDDLGD